MFIEECTCTQVNLDEYARKVINGGYKSEVLFVYSNFNFQCITRFKHKFPFGRIYA